MSKSTSINVIIVISVTILTKLLGLVKQVIIASYYGMTGETDAFLLVSGTINDFGMSIFSALSIVFLADYIKRSKENNGRANIFTSNVIIVFCGLFIPICILLEIFAPQVIGLIAPGMEGESLSQSVLMMQILCPMLIVLCFRTILNSILDANNEFWYGKSLGAIQSIILIFLSVLFYRNGIFVLVFALVITYFIEAGIGFYLVIKKDYYRTCIPHKIWSPDMKALLICMVPLFISNSLGEINALVARGISSNLGEGTISSLSYAQTLKQFVNSILISSTLTVFYTNIVTKSVNSKSNNIGEFVVKCINIYLVILMPISIITYVCSNDLISIVYGHGAVTSDSVGVTSQALLGYSIGFVPLAISGVLLRVYYSNSDTWFPLICNVFSVIVNVAFAIWLSSSYGILGITLATAVSYAVSCILLSFSLKKYIGKIDWRYFIQSIGKVLFASLIAVVFINVLDIFTIESHIIHLLLIIVLTCFSFYIALYWTKCGELLYILKLSNELKKKITNKIR